MLGMSTPAVFAWSRYRRSPRRWTPSNIYYHNQDTEASTWDHPVRLRTPAPVPLLAHSL